MTKLRIMDFLSDDFDRQFRYDGPLGAQWHPQSILFRLWAPLAEQVILHLYSSWDSPTPLKSLSLERQERGVWELAVAGLGSGVFYTYQVTTLGIRGEEAVDPYARAVGPQGRRGYVFDPSLANPEGWEQDSRPLLAHVTDTVIYELHIRDLSSLTTSGIHSRGQFLGLTEELTQNPEGLSTGLDHIADLGVTHVHLLPVFDFDELDDLKFDPEHYNWGYNPRNFNAPKNAYSSDPRNPLQAVLELKQVVQALHRRGLRVVLDVVYNHTYSVDDSCLNKVFPRYYYRLYGSHFSNGSGCGNELATERPMVSKYILDSLAYWKEEYHLDGFRFDLMGLYDVETMNEASRILRRGDPNFLLYGEGWTGGLSTLPDDRKVLKRNASKVREVGFFSDDTRDSLKGPVFDAGKAGFANGAAGWDENVRFAVAGCMAHPQIRWQQLNGFHEPWSQGPHQTINYIAAHDNHTLWDKLAHTNPLEPESERIKMAKLAHGLVFLSQGIPFLHAGEEFLRTKKGEENSYRSPDSINGLDWSAKTRHWDFYRYIQGLIALRRSRPALRLRSNDQIRQHLVFMETLDPGVVAWMLRSWAGGDPSEHLFLVVNAQPRAREVYLPSGRWAFLADAQRAGTEPFQEPSRGMIILPGRSLAVLATQPVGLNAGTLTS